MIYWTKTDGGEGNEDQVCAWWGEGVKKNATPIFMSRKLKTLRAGKSGNKYDYLIKLNVNLKTAQRNEN